VVVIETERLLLRPLVMEDVDDFFALHAQPEVAQFTTSFDREEARRRLEQVEREWASLGYGAMAVLERADGRYLGRCGLKHWPQFDETEIGWSLRREEWGRGYATEAARAVLEWGFGAFELPYVTAMIAPANERSLRVAQRLDFSPLREDVLLGVPVIVHALSRPPQAADD
jgi:RimJ/RimL family protein N-acetyltransferase